MMDRQYYFAPFLTALLMLLISISCQHRDVTIGGSGLLEADEVVVSAQTAGEVVSLRFDEGAEVKEDDTLLVIDPSRIELQLNSARAGKKTAEARLKAARIKYEQARETERFATSERDRVASLLRSGTATQKQLDRLEHELTTAVLNRRLAQANVAALEAELSKLEADIALLQRRLQDCYPLSPKNGIITEKYVEKGEVLAPGKPIAKISNLDTLWVMVYLPTADFSHVKIGDKAVIDTEAGGKQYEGRVVWTSEEAEFTPKNVQTKKARSNLVYAVKVRVANTDGLLKIGMPVYVTIEQP
jgi:HlyD family secretion protein